MGRLFGNTGTITLTNGAGTTGPPNGTGSVEIGRGGRLKGASLLAVTGGQAGSPAAVVLFSDVAGGLVGITLASGTVRGSLGLSFVEGDGLAWIGDLPIATGTPTWLQFWVLNESGVTLSYTFNWIQEYEGDK